MSALILFSSQSSEDLAYYTKLSEGKTLLIFALWFEEVGTVGSKINSCITRRSLADQISVAFLISLFTLISKGLGRLCAGQT